MKLHEYQAREILSAHRIPFVAAEVAQVPEEVFQAANRLGEAVVVKAQVHAGGRGKAGGVKLAGTATEAAERAEEILGLRIKGHLVHKVLVARAITAVHEYYLGAVLDRERKTVTLIASDEGGVEIEELARVRPEKIIRVPADPHLGFPPYRARVLARRMGLHGALAASFATIAQELFTAFVEHDCSLLEINPLALSGEGDLVALDVKMVVDDNGLWRHPELAELGDLSEETPAELRAREFGLNYVQLEGNIGCIVNGAGLAMATMDAVKLHGGEPANFLDIGGGAKADAVRGAVTILLADGSVDAILVNIFGGITRCDAVAEGLVDGLASAEAPVPVVARLVGTNQEEGRRVLEGRGLRLVSSMKEAAQLAVELAAERQGALA